MSQYDLLTNKLQQKYNQSTNNSKTKTYMTWLSKLQSTKITITIPQQKSLIRINLVDSVSGVKKPYTYTYKHISTLTAPTIKPRDRTT